MWLWWALLVSAVIVGVIGVIGVFVGIIDYEPGAGWGGFFAFVVSAGLIYLALIHIFFVSWPGGPSTARSITPTHTPTQPAAKLTPTGVPQLCLGNFIQTATVQIGAEPPATQQLTVQGPCLSDTKLQLGQPIDFDLPADTGSTPVHVTLQPYSNDFVVRLSTADPVTLSNCTGATTLSQTFTMNKVVQPGLLLGGTLFDTSPPPLQGNALDQLASAVFSQESANLTKTIAGTYSNFTLTADPHSRVTVLISWDEHFIAGQASLSPADVPLISGIYAIPTKVQFGSASTPTSVTC